MDRVPNDSYRNIEDSPEGQDLFGVTVAHAAVFVGATLFGVCVSQYFPWKDPIDVVGVPLLAGYSERSEQMGFYSFFLATVLIAIAFRPLTARVASVSGQLFGAFGGVSLIGVIAWCRDVNLLPLVLFGGCGCYFSGAAGRCAIDASKSSWLLWGGGIFLWMFGNPELWSFLRFNLMLMLAFGLLLAFVVVLAVMRPGERQTKWRSVFMGTTVPTIVFGIWLAPFNEIQLVLSGMLCCLLGIGIHRNCHQRFSATLRSPGWWNFLGLMALAFVVISRLPGRWTEAVPRMWAGAGAMLSCVTLIPKSGPDAISKVVCFHSSRFPAGTILMGLLLGIASLSWDQPWFSLLLIMLVVGVWFSSPSSRSIWKNVWLVVLMALAFVPTGLRSGGVLDEYHDGYALACLWEFEHGRALYSEIFPLRSFEFFVGLLGRGVLPATVEGYLFSLSILKFLPIVGVTLLSLIWTRSTYWSFAVGLVCATLSHLDSRQGMQVVLVACQLGLCMSLRGGLPNSLAMTALIGGVAACVGFDAFVTVVAATGITTFLVPDLYRRCRLCFADLAHRLVISMMFVAAASIPFTLVISLWQGTTSAAAYWTLLLDYAQHFNAAYGLPVSWSSPGQRFLVVSNLLLLSLFSATAVFRWSSLSPRRQRGWCFLTIAYFLTLHRGLGRSDEFHLRDSVYLTFGLVAIGTFEFIRAAARHGQAASWWNWKKLALVVGVLAAWKTKHASLGPFELVRYCSALSAEETFPLPRDEFIAQNVAPGESIWAIDHPLVHVANQRHGPTRHPLAHCIGSPSEQCRAVRDIRQNPPKLIVWPASEVAREQWSRQIPLGWQAEQQFTAGFPTGDVMIGVDSVPAPLRYYMISQFVLRHYRPSQQAGYLVPAESDFNGLSVFPNDLNGSLRCGWLPLSWGMRRHPFLSQRIEQSFELRTWHALERSGATDSRSDASTGWRFDGSINPREFNYLVLSVAAHELNPREASEAALFIRLSSGSDRDPQSEASFKLKANGEPHSYLVPVGCWPAWVWRSEIQDLELSASPGCRISLPQVAVLRVNDLDCHCW